MTAPILTRLTYLALAALATWLLFDGVARLWGAASRGDLHVMQWGGER